MNGTDGLLSDLRVQQCVMLKGASGFSQQTNDNKLFEKPYAACRSADGRRWIITAWTPCERAWGNPPCPCLHSDPKFPDCPAGESRMVFGWLSFFEGTDIRGEQRRINRRTVRARCYPDVRWSRQIARAPGFRGDRRCRGRGLSPVWSRISRGVRVSELHHRRLPAGMAGSRACGGCHQRSRYRRRSWS